MNGNGGELRVRADRADDDELRSLVEPCLLEDVRAHREVREPVAAGIRAVGADSPDLGGEVEHELGIRIAEHPGGVVHRGEVVVGAACDDDVVAVGLEPLDEVRPEESSAAGDQRAHPGEGYKSPLQDSRSRHQLGVLGFSLHCWRRREHA